MEQHCRAHRPTDIVEHHEDKRRRRIGTCRRAESRGQGESDHANHLRLPLLLSRRGTVTCTVVKTRLGVCTNLHSRLAEGLC